MSSATERQSNMIMRLAERDLRTKFGTFLEILYYDGQKESIALVTGDVTEQDKVLCRIHSHCISAHVFNSIECTCREEMETSQRLIQKAGRGVIVWLDQEGKGNGHLALMQSIPYKKAGLPQGEAYLKAGFSPDARNYRTAAQILADLKVNSIVLLANNADKAEELRKHSIAVSGIIPPVIGN